MDNSNDSCNLVDRSSPFSLNKIWSQLSFRAIPVDQPPSDPSTCQDSANSDEPGPSSQDTPVSTNGSSDAESSTLAGNTAKKGMKEWRDRFIWGFLIGIFTAWAIIYGGIGFTAAIALTAAGGAWEYFKMVNSGSIHRNEAQMQPLLVNTCCLLCFLLPVVTWWFDGQVGWALLPSAIPLIIGVMTQHQASEARKRRQVLDLLFGLFYCGYLPCFWVKVRLGLTPSLLSDADSPWLVDLDGSTWSVGSVVTFMSFATIMAADSFAYIGGKLFGRTQLCSISPKKTWEGAACGLIASILMTVALSQLFHWPSTVSSVVALSCLVFFSSVSGDLFESHLKRVAGMKDSGSLIPGHGGILDRIDSYMFTGAIVYLYISYFVAM